MLFLCAHIAMIIMHSLLGKRFCSLPTRKGLNQRSKDVTQTQQQRPKSPTVTLALLASKDKGHNKLHRTYIFFLFSLPFSFFQILSDFPCEFREYNVGNTTTEGHVCMWPANSALPAGSCSNELSAKTKRTSGEYINLLPGGSASAWAVSSPGEIRKEKALIFSAERGSSKRPRDAMEGQRAGWKISCFFSIMGLNVHNASYGLLLIDDDRFYIPLFSALKQIDS